MDRTTSLAGLAAVLGGALVTQPAQAQAIVVGGKNFTEQQIISEMTAQLLKAKGFTVDKRAGMGSAPLRQAQEAGQIDVYWEYTGTSLITYNKVTDKLDAAQTYAKVKELDAAKGLVWLNPSKANNPYALATHKDDAAAKGNALTPAIRKASLEKNPIIADPLNELSAKLNASVDVEKKTVEEVAIGFLKDQKLI